MNNADNDKSYLTKHIWYMRTRIHTETYIYTDTYIYLINVKQIIEDIVLFFQRSNSPHVLMQLYSLQWMHRNLHDAVDGGFSAC